MAHIPESANQGSYRRLLRNMRKQAELDDALRAWVETQSRENAHRLYSVACAHLGIKPVVHD